MPAPNATLRGVSAAWLFSGFTVVDGQITGGTIVEKKFNFVQETSPTYAASADAASSFYNVQHAGRVTVEYPEVTTVIDGITGSEKAGGSGSADKISITLLDTLPATVDAIKDLRGLPVLVVIPHGVTSNGAVSYYYMLGKLTSEIKITSGNGGVSTLPIEFTGTAYTANAGGDTALTIAPTSVTLIANGSPTVTPPALVSGDLTELKAGTLVQKTV